MDFQRIAILLGLAVISYLLILAWNDDYGSQATKDVVVQSETPVFTNSVDDVPTTIPTGEIGNVVPQLEEEISGQQTTITRTTTNNYITVKTDVLEVTIDLKGGDIVKVALPKYPANIDTPDVPFILVDPRNNYSSQSGLIGPDGIDKSGKRPLLQSSLQAYDLGNNDELNVELTLPGDNRLKVVKQFVFRRGDYLIDVNYLLNNNTSVDAQVAFFSQIKRDGQSPKGQETNAMGLRPFVGGATRTDDELYKKLDFDDIEEENYKSKIEGGYMAMVQHYFVSAWVPGGTGAFSYQARKLPNQDTYLFGFTTPLMTVIPGGSGKIGAQYYVGPKDQYRLEEIADGLNLTVDYGFLWWLAQPLFSLLTFIHGLVNNWGIAIILLTVIVKSLLFPLSAASFRSMAKMRKLQPEMARLKERFGDDKQKFSQAMMELYKKEGANPLGGCFPILLQMPVFLALYWTLMESVELRQAPFILWINDLSVMDPYFVLPILMGGSMFLTQMMQPEPPDPVQAKVFKMMPIMFTFFFLWFPSGLVLYWLVNNLLSLAQQLYVTRQIEKAG